MGQDRAGRRPVITVLAALVATGLLLAGCSKDSGTASGSGGGDGAGTPAANIATTPVTVAPTTKPKQGGKLVYALEAESDGLDPTKGRWAVSGLMVAFAVYDPLFAWSAEGKAVPYLIDSYEASPDYKTWTFKLRSGIKFHNGRPLDAAAVKKMVEGFRASALTGPAVRPIESADVVDDLTVRVNMSTPWANFPVVLTAQGAAVPAPETIDDPDGGKRPIGTGPFVFKEWIPNDRIVFERNPNYWMRDADGNQLPYLDEVVFRPLPDAGARVKALQAGDVNMMIDNHTEQMHLLQEQAQAGRLQYLPDNGEKEEVFIMLNTQKPPLTDPKLRQALAYATDVDQYLEIAGTDPALKATNPFQPDSPWYADVDPPSFDLVKARSLMDEYNAANGNQPVKVTLSTTTTPENQKLVQLIAEQWKAIGVEVQVGALEQTKMIADGAFGNYDALLWRQFGSPDPDGDYHWWIGANAAAPGELGLNFARLKDDQIDQALELGRANGDPATRQRAYTEVYKRWNELVPYIWLEHVLWVIGADNTVRGIGNNAIPDASGVAAIPSRPLVTGAHRLTATWLEQ